MNKVEAIEWLIEAKLRLNVEEPGTAAYMTAELNLEEARKKLAEVLENEE